MQRRRQFQMEIRNISRRHPRSVDDAELPLFHFVPLQRTAKKRTAIVLLTKLFVW